MTSFVHLHVHSNYSFCRGASRLEELVIAARRRGMDTMALTDTNGMHGLIWFLDAAKAAGLRPIVGAEIDLRALAQRADFEVEGAGDPWVVPGEDRSLRLTRGDGTQSGNDGGAPVDSGRRAGGRVAGAPDRGREGERLADLHAWGRAVVLVRDAEGYAGLCRLLSALHHGGVWPPPENRREEDEAARQQQVTERAAGHPLRRQGSEAGERAAASRSAFKQERPERPLTRAWLAGELARLRGCVILSADAGLLAAIAARKAEPGGTAQMKDAGAPDLYVELRPGVAREALIRFARESGLPLVATGGVVLADAEAYPLHRLLRAIDLNTCLSRLAPEELAPAEATLASPQEMARRHPDRPEALANAVRIADRCRFVLPRGTPIFPEYEELRGPDVNGEAPPASIGTAAGVSSDGAPSLSEGTLEAPTADYAVPSPDALLERDCFEGAERRYGEMNEAIAERLEYELSIVREKRFSPYFLVVRDIVARAPRTCGRGSAAASLISYALGITHVDPIRFDLFFERFLNPGRIDPPDIDVDFPWDERDDILEWTFRRYGRRRAAMVSNHVTFQARAAVREIAKVYGLTDEEIGRVTKRMPWFTGDVIEATRTHPVFKDLTFPPPWPEILRLARRIDGYPRGLSVHCGGVVIVPDAIDRHVPVQPSAKGVDVVQWEKDQCEDSGLVKIDLLGNRSLAVIRDACRSVLEGGGPDIRFETFRPIDDPVTQDLIRRGDTVGVFYVESPAMRQLQAKCRVGDFEHLVIHSSIIRPAANDYIREYVRRLRGGGWTPLHPLMGELLAETYGIMVYQEDVAKIAIAMAGFDAASADGLRKILSKKNKEERMRDYRERFFRGAVDHGVDAETATKVWDMILSFAGYSFCKPHSASYALVSFKAAYLRAHHPAEFMAAVISNGGGYYSAFAYISESRRMGLRVLPPDVNESRREYTGSTTAEEPPGSGAPRDAAILQDSARAGEGAGQPRRPRGWIRIGLMQLKGFPSAAIDAILDARERGGRFASFEEFLVRCEDTIGPAAIRILIRAGAIDSLLTGGERGAGAIDPRGAIHRGDLFWRLTAWERGRSRVGPGRNRDRRGGREDLLLPPADPGPLPIAGPYEERTFIEQEIESLGFLISRHPLSLFRRRIEEARAVRACDLARHVGKQVRVIGWYITGKTVQTRNGEPMEFLSFEDTTALYETTFFPRVYARFCHMMTRLRPYLLTGRVEEDFGAIALTVSDVRFLDAEGAVRNEVPVCAPHVGGTSPRSEAWNRIFGEGR